MLDMSLSPLLLTLDVATALLISPCRPGIEPLYSYSSASGLISMLIFPMAGELLDLGMAAVSDSCLLILLMSCLAMIKVPSELIKWLLWAKYLV